MGILKAALNLLAGLLGFVSKSEVRQMQADLDSWKGRAQDAERQRDQLEAALRALRADRNANIDDILRKHSL